MGTRIFDSVQVYNTPGTTSFNLVAKRLHSVDLAAFGAVGNVVANFPAGTEVGEAIGISLLTSSGAASLGRGTGSAQFDWSIQFQDECALFAWSGTTWALVSKYIDPVSFPFTAASFDNAALSGGSIDITHNLGSNFPGVVLYDDLGQLVQPALWGVTRIDADSFTLELDATLLPINGSWGVGVSYN